MVRKDLLDKKVLQLRRLLLARSTWVSSRQNSPWSVEHCRVGFPWNGRHLLTCATDQYYYIATAALILPRVDHSLRHCAMACGFVRRPACYRRPPGAFVLDLKCGDGGRGASETECLESGVSLRLPGAAMLVFCFFAAFWTGVGPPPPVRRPHNTKPPEKQLSVLLIPPRICFGCFRLP